ncbi:HTH_Tnp_Tc3_2 domain-containing protein [Trichonephila clavipes]|nr:HTH_Tnp_Tc3_2 domain-containing protein [Trichonephila clavipes]
MSQRRRLPNSLRWRAVGWMEMGLSQADVARRLNVSCSVVQRLWNQYQSEDSVSRRPVPGRPRATTPAEDRFLALSARRRRTTTVPQLVTHLLISEVFASIFLFTFLPSPQYITYASLHEKQ